MTYSVRLPTRHLQSGPPRLVKRPQHRDVSNECQSGVEASDDAAVADARAKGSTASGEIQTAGGKVRLLRLRVERFRGLRSLDWVLSDRLVCLVGPGDSGKSTILDAIARVAAPGNVTFSNSDFLDGDAREGLEIEATFGDLPVGCGLLAESRFGLLLGALTLTACSMTSPALTSRRSPFGWMSTKRSTQRGGLSQRPIQRADS